ncbi:unnamed protein product [Vitrella brassicaformis CCMP3155]|uniref:Uncharacterized protein n=1 Tax=Vitrella brassicaformis (strain CCMP3155) TaxID=1169540 RepID=A0A0G4EGH7_VITBC|nr:unnamed protein product [Vitrella brassicaformis CCMP3155]|eukprot:CEL94565.1 unnamed protein product [Vitrella brassicaformis CCMP3155]
MFNVLLTNPDKLLTRDELNEAIIKTIDPPEAWVATAKIRLQAMGLCAAVDLLEKYGPLTKRVHLFVDRHGLALIDQTMIEGVNERLLRRWAQLPQAERDRLSEDFSPVALADGSFKYPMVVYYPDNGPTKRRQAHQRPRGLL